MLFKATEKNTKKNCNVLLSQKIVCRSLNLFNNKGKISASMKCAMWRRIQPRPRRNRFPKPRRSSWPLHWARARPPPPLHLLSGTREHNKYYMIKAIMQGIKYILYFNYPHNLNARTFIFPLLTFNFTIQQPSTPQIPEK